MKIRLRQKKALDFFRPRCSRTRSLAFWLSVEDLWGGSSTKSQKAKLLRHCRHNIKNLYREVGPRNVHICVIYGTFCDTKKTNSLVINATNSATQGTQLTQQQNNELKDKKQVNITSCTSSC